MDVDALDARLAAVERALADGETPPDRFADAVAVASDVDEHAAAIEELRERTDELAAATDALRGYVGELRSVNEEVEGRATTAIERVDHLEARLDSLDGDGRSQAFREEPAGVTPNSSRAPSESPSSPSESPSSPSESSRATADSRRNRAGAHAEHADSTGPASTGRGRSDQPAAGAGHAGSTDGSSGHATGGGWTDEPLTDAFANGVVPEDARRDSCRGPGSESTSGHRLYERVRSWLRSG